MDAREPDTISLIINGDDFGASAAVNAALVRCHREGVLTSASMLANGAAADEALALARAYPSLGIGVHVNLTDGAPLSQPAAIPSLVDRAGRFRAFPAQLVRIVGGRLGSRRSSASSAHRSSTCWRAACRRRTWTAICMSTRIRGCSGSSCD